MAGAYCSQFYADVVISVFFGFGSLWLLMTVLRHVWDISSSLYRISRGVIGALLSSVALLFVAHSLIQVNQQSLAEFPERYAAAQATFWFVVGGTLNLLMAIGNGLRGYAGAPT